MNKNISFPSVVFFGTPEFARYCLAYLVTSGFPVLAVVIISTATIGDLIQSKFKREAKVKSIK